MGTALVDDRTDGGGISIVDGVTQDDLCAESLYGLHLRWVGILRQNNDDLSAEYLTGVGHALAEIA